MEKSMEILNQRLTGKKKRPVKVLQFGEGNFLRGFVDYMIDVANEKGVFDGDVVLVKPIEYGTVEPFRRQQCQYTVSLRGIVEGKEQVETRKITCVSDIVEPYKEADRLEEYARLPELRFLVSNTTEAGIVYDHTDSLLLNPPKTYPGKLTKFLYQRYQWFQGAGDKGLILLPVELIDDNGIQLGECVKKLAALWKLEEGFLAWLDNSCTFASTLVDRIITGYPKEEAENMWQDWGYEDRLIVTGEPFALWVIESSRDIRGELPLDKAGLPVVFTDNQKPYKQRKVRILNGAHTSFALAAYLAGHDTVLEAMEDDLIRGFMEGVVYDEVIPTLELPEEELAAFAGAVTDRFRNPFIHHSLLAISLNSVSKWKARCMPSFLEYIKKFGEIPSRLAFSLAALMAFYSGKQMGDRVLLGRRGQEEYQIIDDEEVLSFFEQHEKEEADSFVKAFLSKDSFFGTDLTKIDGVERRVAGYLSTIRSCGMKEALLEVEKM